MLLSNVRGMPIGLLSEPSRCTHAYKSNSNNIQAWPACVLVCITLMNCIWENEFVDRIFIAHHHVNFALEKSNG